MDYKQKYLKYKKKYITLKQEAGALTYNKKKDYKDKFSELILYNDNIYSANITENPHLLQMNEKAIRHYLKKKIDIILYVKNEINKDNKHTRLLEQIDISYREIIDKDIKEINKILEDKIIDIEITMDNLHELFTINNIDDTNKNRIIHLLKLFNRDLIEKKNKTNITSYYDIKYYDEKKIEFSSENYSLKHVYPQENILIFNNILVSKPGILRTKKVRISGIMIGFYINDDNDSIILFETTDRND